MIVKQINNIRIEKFQKEVSCTKIYTNGNKRKINCKKQTWFRAINPKGNILLENRKYSHIKTYAENNTMYIKS